MPPLTLTHTKEALKDWDETSRMVEAGLLYAKTPREYMALFVLEDAANERVAQAFFKDTADRNRLEDCRRVHPKKLKEWVEKLEEVNHAQED